MLYGLKKFIAHSHPIVVLTGPFHSKSHSRPAGGHLISHFGGILVSLENYERFIEYTLHQHPFLPFQKERFWKPLQLQNNSHLSRRFKRDPLNLTLDSFFHPNSL
jgi:hypothetical protein